MYIYKTTLFKDTTNVIGAPASNDTDRTDFEGATKKPNALRVDMFEVQETTFYIETDYATFNGYIDGIAFQWSDVRYLDSDNEYVVLLFSANPL